MNIAQTIVELEKQAEQYTAAADALKVLVSNDAPSPRRGRKPGTASAKAVKIDGRKRRRKMSEEANSYL